MNDCVRRRGFATVAAAALVATCLAPGVVEARVLDVPRDAAGLGEALSVAVDGDTVVVHGGTHAGPFVIEKSIELVGEEAPVLDGGGHGTVVRVRAPRVRVTGFGVRGSGPSLDGEDAGITVEAAEAVVAGNRIDDTLFGIILSKADRSLVRANTVHGRPLPAESRGDAIRLWWSHDVRVEDNEVIGARDVVVWYSKNAELRRNRVHDGRYGFHFMFCDDVVVEDNVVSGNSVGVYLMYSRRAQLRRNRLAANRGPSGYGVGLKDMDDAVLEENDIVDNGAGVYVDNSPREIDATTRFARNVIAANDVGIEMQPLVRRNFFSENSFVDNEEQVAIVGGGKLAGDSWTVDGKGNYWSDYVGYDADGDGIGDMPYRAERFFESLVDRHPDLKLFRHAPLTAAIDLAARAFPVIRPQPKLVDDGPLMAPIAVAHGARAPSASAPLTAAGAGLVALAAALASVPAPRPAPRRTSREAEHAGRETMIALRDVTRRFGRTTALDRLTMDVARGEAVALWGKNGAGKTTALRCALGILPSAGTIEIAGFDVREHPKRARRMVGFVPQEVRFYDDLTVGETLRFFAALRGTPEAPRALLERLGLDTETAKRVRELSGGRKRLLSLAVALLDDPPILLLDEPTSSLDRSMRERFLHLLEELKRAGKTMLFSSHHPGEVFRLADRVVVLDAGRKILDAPPAALVEDLDWRVHLRIEIHGDGLDRAVSLLARHGYPSAPNGQGVYVTVPALHKLRPIELLLRHEFSVTNFDFDWEGDA